MVRKSMIYLRLEEFKTTLVFVDFSVLLDTRTPFMQAKRFRGKINIQKPRKSHYERQLFFDLAKPILPSKYKNKQLVELCGGPYERRKRDDEEIALQRILANEVREKLDNSRLVAFFHANPMENDNLFKAKVLFHRQNMKLDSLGRKTMEMAVEGSKYEAILSLFVSRNMVLFSPEAKILPMMKINKKFPQLTLLAGIYEGQFLSRDKLVHLSTIPNIETAQAALVQTLNGVGAQLVSHLNSHQTTLVSHLEGRVKQLEEEK